VKIIAVGAKREWGQKQMPKYKVTATMDVGYTAFIEADTEEEAWTIARNGDEADWGQTDNGHDWTVENIWEIK